MNKLPHPALILVVWSVTFIALACGLEFKMFPAFTALGTVGVYSTGFAAILLFLYQVVQARQTAKREARTHLTMAYVAWKTEILRGEDNLRLAEKWFWRRWTVGSLDKAREIEFFSLLLHTLFLEWHFVREYGHDSANFANALQAIVGRMRQNLSQGDSYLRDDFHEIYAGFPMDFRQEVLRVLR